MSSGDCESVSRITEKSAKKIGIWTSCGPTQPIGLMPLLIALRARFSSLAEASATRTPWTRSRCVAYCSNSSPLSVWWVFQSHSTGSRRSTEASPAPSQVIVLRR